MAEMYASLLKLDTHGISGLANGRARVYFDEGSPVIRIACSLTPVQHRKCISGIQQSATMIQSLEYPL